MTIKVQQEALIAIQSQTWPISNDGEDYVSRFRKFHSDDDPSCHYQHYQLPVVGKQLQSSISVDDEDSVYTDSTSSYSEPDSDFDRKVTFAEDIVSDVWTRPYSKKDDIPNLYYSNEDTQRFRQEYRMERKLLSTLSADIGLSSIAKEDLSAMLESTSSPPSCRQHRNGISLVVVLHNDRLETFCGNEESSSLPSAHTHENPKAVGAAQNDFFDTPEFWSGSITWW